MDFEYSMRHSLTQCFRSIGRELTEDMIVRYSVINDSFWKRLELGEITKEELLPGRFVALFQEYDIQGVSVEDFRRKYEEGLGEVYRYLDDSLSICRKLRGCVKQYVVTNGIARIQKKKLRLSGLAEVMDGMFISEEIGAPKPDTAFFDYCLANVEEKDRSRILLVGDSLTSDIRGGVQAGIVTCWYRAAGSKNPSDYKPDYEIENLREVFSVLKRDCGLKK